MAETAKGGSDSNWTTQRSRSVQSARSTLAAAVSTALSHKRARRCSIMPESQGRSRGARSSTAAHRASRSAQASGAAAGSGKPARSDGRLRVIRSPGARGRSPPASGGARAGGRARAKASARRRLRECRARARRARRAARRAALRPRLLQRAGGPRESSVRSGSHSGAPKPASAKGCERPPAGPPRLRRSPAMCVSRTKKQSPATSGESSDSRCGSRHPLPSDQGQRRGPGPEEKRARRAWACSRVRPVSSLRRSRLRALPDAACTRLGR